MELEPWLGRLGSTGRNGCAHTAVIGVAGAGHVALGRLVVLQDATACKDSTGNGHARFCAAESICTGASSSEIAELPAQASLERRRGAHCRFGGCRTGKRHWNPAPYLVGGRLTSS